MALLEEEPPPFDFTPPEIDPSHKPDDSDFEFEMEEETPTVTPAVSTVEMGLSAASAATDESKKAESNEAAASATTSSSSSDDSDDFAAGLDEPDEHSTAKIAESAGKPEAPAAIANEDHGAPGGAKEAAASEPTAIVGTGDDATSDSATDGEPIESTDPDGEKPKRRRRRKPRRGRKKDRGGKSDGGNSSSGGTSASGS